MDTFDFPFHTFSTKYPDPGNRTALGGSYTYAPQPNAPDQRVFILSFKTMRYYENADSTVDTTSNPQLNAAVLDAFYQKHRLWDSFIYPHPVYGNITVKFNKPLEIPNGMEGGNGWLNGFQVELQEQP